MTLELPVGGRARERRKPRSWHSRYTELRGADRAIYATERRISLRWHIAVPAVPAGAAAALEGSNFLFRLYLCASRIKGCSLEVRAAPKMLGKARKVSLADCRQVHSRQPMSDLEVGFGQHGISSLAQKCLAEAVLRFASEAA